MENTVQIMWPVPWQPAMAITYSMMLKMVDKMATCEYDKGWEWKGSKCYGIKKQIEHFYIHP